MSKKLTYDELEFRVRILVIAVFILIVGYVILVLTILKCGW